MDTPETPVRLNLTAADIVPPDALAIRNASHNGATSAPFIVLTSGRNEDGDLQEHQQSLERLFATPHRKRGVTVIKNAADFIQYVTMSATATSQLFYDADTLKARFTAVLNAHGRADSDTTGWHDHLVTYATEFSADWVKWTSKSGTPHTQVAFAELIDERRANILSPDAATLLKVVETLQANKTVKFVGQVRQANGDQKLQFESTTTANAGAKGEITVPDTFKIGVAVFVDDVSYEVNANFRYRISDEGKLTIYYELVNANAVLEHAIKALVSKISSGTALYAYRGEPIKPITALA